MKAPLVFVSSAKSINIQIVFKLILSKLFDLKLTMEPSVVVGRPVLEF
jgi:GTP-binding protein of the ras superfamily involved in termination of M-phase